jgi:hypothetical protein
LRAGFLGRVQVSNEWRPLGIDVPFGPRGGPVFDAAGQLAGMAILDQAGQSRLLPVTVFAGGAGEGGAQEGSVASPARPQADEIYERALSAVVQIIVAT